MGTGVVIMELTDAMVDRAVKVLEEHEYDLSDGFGYYMSIRYDGTSREDQYNAILRKIVTEILKSALQEE
jgi:hypothetical protein